ncbi:anti-sigma factor [Actinophytocola sp.]|uniref:anti-sigma factor n=1 Tax=Actinophytocola sp. TaxID=1872138 RepID=UPI002D7003F2|nr:anti-sigma factor [Actinophytocola sp.]HYQ67319.1 anti-sigma factor [Actinophytocola sp.]
MSADLHTLTGAYALHAVADTERVTFERHLTECASCAQEVRELLATAARLGSATAAEPPPHLRHVVLARIHTEHQIRPRRRRGPALATRLLAGAAAVLVAVTVSLGVLVAQRGDEHRQADVLTSVLLARDVRAVHAGGITVVVSRAQDRGVLLADLPPAPDGHAYQVWTIDSRYHPAGTLAAGRATSELTGVAAADRVAVTVEPDGGSPRPTTAAVAEAVIP